MPNHKQISDQLRAAIRNADISQRQLAFRVGIDPGVLSRFLSGTGGLSVASIDQLGTLLGLTLTEVSTKPEIPRKSK